jgi:hypothetical protein
MIRMMSHGPDAAHAVDARTCDEIGKYGPTRDSCDARHRRSIERTLDRDRRGAESLCQRMISIDVA